MRSVIITYYGAHCFRLQSGSVSLLVDPDTDRLKAEVIVRTIASARTEDIVGVRGDGAKEITCPGEYEVGGIEVVGVPLRGEMAEKELRTAYAVTWEEMRFGFLGNTSQTPEADVLDALEMVDVLVLSVIPKQGFAPEVAAKLVKQIEPALVVPSYEKDLNAFLKTLGQKASSEEKIVFKKKDLVGGKGTVVYLKSART